MKKIVLISCGIRNDVFKSKFYQYDNKKEELVNDHNGDDLIFLYDGDGIIVN